MATTSVASGATAGPFEQLLDNPEATRTFDYCEWRFSEGGAAESLPDFEAIFESADGESTRRERVAAAMANAGTKIALAAKNLKACRRVFEKGTKEHEKPYQKALSRLRSAARHEWSDDPEIAAVQKTISDLWARDQAARNVYIRTDSDVRAGPRYWTRQLVQKLAVATDAESTRTMQDLLTRYDWIDSHRFGEAVASHAWLLVQHADRQPDFQALALARMEKYLENGGVRKRDYAYLWDRVAVNHDRKQRYGTQPDWECKNGKLDFMPMEDPEGVDALRETMGLGPAQEDLESMARSTCGR